MNMRSDRVFGIVLVASAFLLVAQSASAAVIVDTEESSYTVDVGGTLEVDVTFTTTGDDDVSLWGNLVTVNPNRAQITAVEPTASGFATDFTISTDGAQASVGGLSLDGETGSNTFLYRLTITGVAPGTTFLRQQELVPDFWKDGDFQDIDVTFTAGGLPGDAVITVVPIPAAAWLLGSGLVALGAVARRRKQTA